MLALVTLLGCNPYDKQIPTREPIVIDNVYADPLYDFSQIVNVLIMPIDNPNQQYNVSDSEELLASAILKNFGLSLMKRTI